MMTIKERLITRIRRAEMEIEVCKSILAEMGDTAAPVTPFIPKPKHRYGLLEPDLLSIMTDEWQTVPEIVAQARRRSGTVYKGLRELAERGAIDHAVKPARYRLKGQR